MDNNIRDLYNRAHSEDANARLSVAEDVNCSPDLLDFLSRDYTIFSDRETHTKEYWIQRAVSRNPSTSLDTLIRMSKENEDFLTRFGILTNEKINGVLFADMLEQLYWDVYSEKIYYAHIEEIGIAYSDEYIIFDADYFLDEAITAIGGKLQWGTYQMFSEDFIDITRIVFAKNTKTAPQILKQLSGTADNLLKQQIATNASTPKEVLELLSKSNDEITRLRAAYTLSKNN